MSLEAQRQMEHVYELLGSKLDSMRQYFKQDVKITLVVRNTVLDDADLVLTEDDYDKVIETINTLKERAPVIVGGDEKSEEAA